MTTLLPNGHPWQNQAPTLNRVPQPQPVGVWPGILPATTMNTAPYTDLVGNIFTFISGSGAMGTFFKSFGSGAIVASGLRVLTSGIYKISITASINKTPVDAWSGQMYLSIDQIHAQVPAAVVQSNNYFTQFATLVDPVEPPTTSSTLVWYVPILAGDHQLQLRTYGGNNGEIVWAQTIAVSLFRTDLPREPLGSRDPTLQPCSSWSIWNTAIGSGAQWSASGDSDTQLLTVGSFGALNSSQWSVPVYTGSAGNPLQTWSLNDTVYVPHGDVTNIRMPTGMVVAPPVSGGDHTIALFGIDKRFMFSGFNATVNQAPTQPGVLAGRDQISDMYNGFNHATGQGAGQIPGLIRSWEIRAGSINHMLGFGLSSTLLKTVQTPWTGLAYPNWESDYNGAFGQYTGGSSAIQYGITIGIPASVDITTLGLTASGLILARCLQDYGAIHYIQSGAPNPNVTLYAEQDVSLDTPQLVDMQSDWNSIILPRCRILRNQSPITINGGGTPRQPMQPGIST